MSAAPDRGSAAGRPRGRVVPAVAAAVVLGLVLRLVPTLKDPGLDLLSDAAYHQRLVVATLAAGQLPARDPLCEAPEGRDPGRYLPPGLYLAAAALHRLLTALGSTHLRFNLMVLVALSGALVAVPVALIARVLFGETRGAVVAALVVVTLPAHLHRSLGYWVRYDALGTLLVVAHLACAARALGTDRATRHANAGLSALLMVAAATVWRVALIVPVLETCFVIVWVAARGATARVREWFATVVVAGTLLLPAIEYLRVQRFIFSSAWLPAVVVAAALFVPHLDRAGRRPVRSLILAAAVAVGVGVGAQLGAGGQYDAVADLVRAKVELGVFGRAWIPPRTMLLMGVEELYGLTPLGLLVGPQQLFAVGPWMLAAPFLLFSSARGAFQASAEGGAAMALMGFLTAAFVVMSLLFLRNEILLGPLAAVWCGGLWCVLSSPAAAGASRGRRKESGRGPRARPRSTIAVRAQPAVFGLYALSLLATAICGVLLVSSRHERMEPGLRAALDGLRVSTPPGAAVLSLWHFGYDIQAYAGCATVTDGLLESPGNQRAILESYAAFLERDSATLVRFLARHRVAYVLVPPPSELIKVADVVRAPILDRLERGLPLTGADLDLVLVRLMDGRGDPALEWVSTHGGYRIYRRAVASGVVSPG